MVAHPHTWLLRGVDTVFTKLCFLRHQLKLETSGDRGWEDTDGYGTQLAVIAMKVVHPGKPGQAVGWDTQT